jgi:hypothetical protein
MQEHFKNKAHSPFTTGDQMNVEYILIKAVKAFKDIANLVDDILHGSDPHPESNRPSIGLRRKSFHWPERKDPRHSTLTSPKQQECRTCLRSSEELIPKLGLSAKPMPMPMPMPMPTVSHFDKECTEHALPCRRMTQPVLHLSISSSCRPTRSCTSNSRVPTAATSPPSLKPAVCWN